MTNEMKKFVGILLAAIVLAGLSGCRHSAKDRDTWMTSALTHKLDLNADQKAKLEDVQKAFEAARAASATDRAKDLETIKAQVLGDHLDAGVARAMIKAHEARIDANFDTVFAKIAAFHASLTPKQKKEAAEMIEKFNDHME